MSPCIQQMGRSPQIGQPEEWRILIGFWFPYNSWVIREWTWRFGCHDQGEIDPIGSFLRAAAQMEETCCSNRIYVIFLPSLILVTFIALIELMSVYLFGFFCPFLLYLFLRWKISWKYNFAPLNSEYHIRDFWGSSIKLVIDYLHSQA